jgi:hypothetical protein
LRLERTLMFGLFKKKPVPKGPVTLTAGIDVRASAAEIYALLDFSNTRNAKRQLGDLVEPIEGRPDRYMLVESAMPHVDFVINVTDEVPGEIYGYTTIAMPRFGNIVSMHDLYEIESEGPKHCAVELTQSITLIDGLDRKQFMDEMMIMTKVNYDMLDRLKSYAENGVRRIDTLGQHQFA